MSGPELLTILEIARRLGEPADVLAVLRHLERAHVPVEFRDGRILRADLSTELILEGARARASASSAGRSSLEAEHLAGETAKLVRLWHARFGTTPVAVRDLVPLAPYFSAAATARGQAIAISRQLKRLDRQVVAGFQIVFLGMRDHAARFSLRHVEEVPIDGA